jgi:hypothetical protein
LEFEGRLRWEPATWTITLQGETDVKISFNLKSHDSIAVSKFRKKFDKGQPSYAIQGILAFSRGNMGTVREGIS